MGEPGDHVVRLNVRWRDHFLFPVRVIVDGKADDLLGYIQSMMFIIFNMNSIFHLAFVRRRNDLRMVMLCKLGDSGHNALYIDYHGLDHPRDNAQLLLQEATCRSDTVPAEDLVRGAAHAHQL